jgi:hypothetical protein
MLTSIPESVRQAWGEPIARDLTAWLEECLGTGTINRAEWTQAMVRLGTIEHDVADIKGELRGVNERFDRLTADSNARFDRVNERFDRLTAESSARFDRVTAQFDERFDGLSRQMATQMRWSIGLLAVLGTLIAIRVGVGQLTPLLLP